MVFDVFVGIRIGYIGAVESVGNVPKDLKAFAAQVVDEFFAEKTRGDHRIVPRLDDEGDVVVLGDLHDGLHKF